MVGATQGGAPAYQLALDGAAYEVEHFQKPDKARSSYTNVLEEIDDKYKPELDDLIRLRKFDEAVEKACTDRADDIIKPWFTIEAQEGEELPDDSLDIFGEWSTKVYEDIRNPARKYTIRQMLARAIDQANWSGNGIIYKIYDDVEDGNLEAVKHPVDKGARVIGYQVLPRKRVTFDDADLNTIFYVYNNISAASVAKKQAYAYLRIHPSRIIDIVLKDNPEGTWEGQSMILSAIILLIAKMQTSHEIPHMMARILPKHIIKFMGNSKADIDYAKSNLGGLVNRKSITLPGGMEYAVEGFKGKMIDLTDMYDLFYQALAIAADMPLDYLKGVSAGAVTGSGVNTDQYYKSINSDQTRIEPILMAEFLDYALRNHGLKFDDKINIIPKWGTVAPPNKNDEAIQRMRHSIADKNLIAAGLPLDAVNADRVHFGQPPLKAEELVSPPVSETFSIEGELPVRYGKFFLDTHALEDKHTEAFKKVFTKIEEDILAITGAEASFIRRILHRMPKESDIDKIVNSYTKEIEEVTKDLHEEGVRTGTKKAYKDVGMSLTRDFIDPQETIWISTRGAEAVTSVTNTMKEDLRRVLDRGLDEGLGPREVGRSMRDIVGSVARAEKIARTEMLISSGFARQKGHKELGVKYKEWLTAGDASVRDSHVAAEAEGPIPIDQTFGNGLQYPGDSRGSAEEVVNCRCASAPVVASTKGAS